MMLSVYEDTVNNGAVFPETITNLYEKVKENETNGDIDTSTIGEFAYYVEAYSPRAHILGQLTQAMEQNDESVSADMQIPTETDTMDIAELGETAQAETTSEIADATSFSNPSVARSQNKDISDIVVNGTKTKGQSEIESIGKVLGWNIGFANIYVRDDNGKVVFNENGEAQHADGMVDKANKKITIDYNSVKPKEFILKHELSDYLSKNPSAYYDFQNAVMDSEPFKAWVKSKGFDSVSDYNSFIVKDRIRKGDPNFTREGANPEYEANIEMVSDFCGENLFGGEKKP